MASPTTHARRSSGFRYRTRSIGLILIAIVLLPALVYSVFELTTLTRSEEMIGDIYRRQMDAILFSLNQHTMDVASAWAGGIGNALDLTPDANPDPATTPLARYLASRPSIRAVFNADSALRNVGLFSLREDSIWTGEAGTVIGWLKGKSEVIDRLWSASRLDYRKIEPVRLPGPDGKADVGALLFARRDGQGRPFLSGLVLDESRFVADIVMVRCREIAGTEFDIAVLPDSGKGEMQSTGNVRSEEIRQRARIWMLPQHSVGIRLRGETLEGLMKRRFTSNLFLILLLDVVLVAGAWMVFRATRKEMELAALKSDFVSNVSHELRTPLALIRMYAETLEMGRLKDEEKKREYYTTILHESERLSRLVNNVLDFGRMESGRKEYHFAPVDLNDVVSGVLQTYDFHLQGEGFRPAICLAPGSLAVRADREALVEAVINVIDNAVKYSPGEKYLRVSTEVAGTFGIVEIEDHGVGIPLEYQSKVYDTFFRVPAEEVRTKKGSGLGLTLVRHIIDAHKGTITFTSRPGSGTLFRLGFPLAESI